MKDITAVICNWMAARMTKGAVLNLKKYYPDIKVVVVDDGSSDSSKSMGAYKRAYLRGGYNQNERLDPSLKSLKQIENTLFVGFPEHQGHGYTLDRALAHVTTPLMLTMDNDIRIIKEGLLEKMIELYRKDPENTYGVGCHISENLKGPHGTVNYRWLSPHFALWNMEPLKRYSRLSFTNFISPCGNHYGTAAFLCRQLEYDEMHRPRKPYKPVFLPYREIEEVPELWHMRKNPTDKEGSHNFKMWEELIDG